MPEWCSRCKKAFTSSRRRGKAVDTTERLCQSCESAVENHGSTAATLESIPLWSSVCFEGLSEALVGVYYRTNEKRFKMPIYHKADGSDRWIEFDASKSAWQIKRGVHKGTCFADVYFRCKHGVPLETCTSESWYVSGGSGFNAQPASKLRPLASCDSKFSLGQLVRIEGLKQASFLQRCITAGLS